MSNNALTTSTTLASVLRNASADELSVLIDYITDSGDGRLSLSSDTCKLLVSAKGAAEYPASIRTVIANEILSFGGNTLGNVVRGIRNSIPFGSMLDGVLPDMTERVSYAEIVRDVASHLKVDVSKDATIMEMETSILMKIMRDSFAKMTDEQRRQAIDEIGAGEIVWGSSAAAATLLAARLGGFATYRLATIVANGASRALLGRGLSFVATGGAMRTLSVAIGPIGWAITGLWTLADLSAPAYRVTVPCVIQIAYIRQRLLLEATHHACSCGTQVQNSDRFCSKCGAAQEATA